jgi:hypothetical protein
LRRLEIEHLRILVADQRACTVYAVERAHLDHVVEIVVVASARPADSL